MTMLDRMSTAGLINPRAVIGGNNPPSAIDNAKDAGRELRIFLEENPVIETQEQATAAAGVIERTRIAIKSMNDEQNTLTRPHLDALEAIYEPRRKVRNPLTKLYDTLRAREFVYMERERAEREAVAKAAREAAGAAEKAAREAEAKEQEAIQNAALGELTDVGTAIEDADAAFGDYKKAERTAIRAEMAVPVRIRSVMGGRALSMRTTEVLTVTDACQAIKAMGLTEKIQAAILSSARDFRKEFEMLPDGVEAQTERKL